MAHPVNINKETNQIVNPRKRQYKVNNTKSKNKYEEKDTHHY